MLFRSWTIVIGLIVGGIITGAVLFMSKEEGTIHYPQDTPGGTSQAFAGPVETFIQYREAVEATDNFDELVAVMQEWGDPAFVAEADELEQLNESIWKRLLIATLNVPYVPES